MAGKKVTRIDKRKRLEALFERGDYVRFNADANGIPVVNPEPPSEDDMRVWVGPPTPLQREMAVREAQASRARAMLSARGKEGSQDWLTVNGFIQGLSMDALLDYVLDLDDTERVQEARRDVLKEDEWDDFNSLRDSMRQFEEAGSPYDDPEWQGLLERDVAFGDQVTARAAELRAAAREGYSMMPRVEVEKKALDKRIDQTGAAAFMSNYEEWMLFYACRDDEDHSILFFDTVSEMKSQPEMVQEALANRLALFIAESSEAKNSQGAVSGSASSAPSDAAATSEPSTPEASTA
jgi:hypothetical protein